MFPELLDKLRRHQDLSGPEAAQAMGAIMDGLAEPAHIAALLMGLAMKGERPSELVGFASAMRERAVPLPEPAGDVFDTCGTGGDGAQTFNVSTAAAIVLAGCGVRVAKHGNRAASSRCGSADLFEAHGVDLKSSPGEVLASLKRANLAFFFAQAWHPAMRHAGPTRRTLGLRTAFNLLGPLTNPARPARQLVGVSRPEHTELLAGALGDLGSTRAWVVHGANGLDELSTSGYTKVSELRDKSVKTFYLHPADAGLPVATVADLAGGSAPENSAMLDRLLEGEPGPRRDVVLFNTAAALLIAERVGTLTEGVAVAGQSIASGRAAAALASMTEARTR